MPVAGHLAGFTISTGGAQKLLNPWIKKMTFPHNSDVHDVTTFGNRDKLFLATLRHATIAVEGIYATTPDAILAGILNTSQAFALYPGTTAPVAGKYSKYTGTAICTKYEIVSDVSAAVVFTADFQLSGLITRSTLA
jgi:hypothetical protein